LVALYVAPYSKLGANNSEPGASQTGNWHLASLVGLRGQLSEFQ
jgi:hypothetical protein